MERPNLPAVETDVNMEQPDFSITVTPEIELKLRRIEDAPAFYELTDKNRQRLREWLQWTDSVTEVEDTERYIRDCQNRFREARSVDLGILYNREWAGSIGFDTQDGRNSLGYWVGEDFAGHGIVTLSVQAMLDHAFTSMGLDRVNVYCAVDNEKSRAIPERLGFTYDGIVKDGEWHVDHYVDAATYSMSAEEWLRRKA